MTLAGAAALTLSYVLPGPVLLRQFGDRIAETAPAHATLAGTLSLFGDDARAFAARVGLPLEGDRANRLDLPARIELGDGGCVLSLGPEGRPVVEVAADGGHVRPDPALPAGAAVLASDGCLPFLWRGASAADAWAAVLEAHGTNAETVAFTRFDGRVAYAIGRVAGKRGAALLLSEDALTPLRLLLGDGGALVDVRLEGYRTIAGGSFPGRISVLRDGVPLAVFEADAAPR